MPATSCCTTTEKFDIITSDPIHPWVKGSATLYSKEYFELVKRHLNPGGIVTQWVPLYESDAARGEERDRHLLRGLSRRHHLGQRRSRAAATTWSCWARTRRRRSTSTRSTRGCIRPHTSGWRSRWPMSACTRRSICSGSTPGGRRTSHRGCRMPRSTATTTCGFSTWPGMALNVHDRLGIFKAIVSYRHFPADLFVGSPERVRELAAAIQKH